MKMKQVIRWFGGGEGDPLLQKKRMVRRSVAVWLTLVALGWFWLIPKYISAQDKKEEAKPAAAAEAAKPAEAPKPAETPAVMRNDPNGGKTGDGGLLGEYNVADPGDAPDPKKITDPKEFAEAKKAWDEKKKAFDEFQEQVKREPLAVKVAAAAGKNRAGINMTWTLITGFLVMFMQAGFAMVEAGLCRAKNVSHTMAMNFMIYPLGMIGYY